MLSTSQMTDVPADAATAALARGETDTAIAIYEAMLLDPDDHLAGLFGLGVCAARRREWERASNYFTSVLESVPTFGVARAYLATVQFECGNVDTALSNIRLALEHDPDQPIIHVKQGEMLLRMGALPDALVSFNRAARLPTRDETLTAYTRALIQATRKQLRGSIVRRVPSPGLLWQRLSAAFQVK